MKNIKFVLCIVLAVVIIFNTSCKKIVEPDDMVRPLAKSNMLDINADISANFLISSIYLAGYAKPYYPGKIIVSSTWK